MILVNTETIPGYRVREVKGLVQGNTVRAKHMGRDIAAGLRNLVGGELKGYVISFAVVGPVLLLIGLVLLVPRLSIRGAPILRALSEYPERVKVIGLKRTESTVAGAKTAAHSWIVLEIDSRENVELLVRSADVQAVVAEIRRVAPNAKYNPRWDVQRMDVRIR